MRVPLLHAVTDDAVLARADFAPLAAAVLAAGGSRVALHLRGPRTTARRLMALAEALGPEARRHGGLLVVNDRVDVALAAGADGVQLGARSLGAGDARRLAGPRIGIGVSVHAAARVPAAAAADWLLAGTLWPTPSHPGRAAAGPGLLAALAGAVPVVGIGGVTPARAAEARRAGAAGVAALRGIWDAADPARAVCDYLEGWER